MKVVIAGAGPAGLLMANYLVLRSRGGLKYDVHVVERRPDPRRVEAAAAAGDDASSTPMMKKSYPVQLQKRGIDAIRAVIPGLFEKKIEPAGIRPAQFALHGAKGVQKIPLGNPPKLFVDQSQMTLAMLDELITNCEDSKGKLTLDFDCTIEDLNLDTKEVSVVGGSNNKNKSIIKFDKLVGADGGRSVVRHKLTDMGLIDSIQKDIPNEYRLINLESPSMADKLDPKCLHAWMLDNGKVRIIAAPFPDSDANQIAAINEDTALSSLPLARGALVYDTGDDPIEGMTSPQQVMQYFEKLAPGSISQYITDEEAEKLIRTPPGSAPGLVTVRCCDKLHARDCVVLLGDAAHASSQAVGHGCISALQDVQILGQLLEQYNDDWYVTLQAYTDQRIEDAQALYEMSDYAVPDDNFMKMEWNIRQVVRKVLPPKMTEFMRPLPVELLSDTTLSYSDVLDKSKWWIDRVKISKDKANE